MNNQTKDNNQNGCDLDDPGRHTSMTKKQYEISDIQYDL